VLFGQFLHRDSSSAHSRLGLFFGQFWLWTHFCRWPLSNFGSKLHRLAVANSFQADFFAWLGLCNLSAKIILVKDRPSREFCDHVVTLNAGLLRG